MKLTSLAAAAAALLVTTLAAAPADAQMRDRTVVKRTTVVRHGHGGWARNHHKRKVCRVTVRHGVRHRVCTWR